jgi:Uma2 family endonuclease
MSTLVAPPEKKRITAEEFLALPDDGTDRWLLDGEVYPKDRRITVRNRHHSQIEATVAYLLKGWLDRQPRPRGKVHSGEAGFRLGADRDTLFGIDVAYASAELVAATDPELAYYDGPPVLAVEILSPSDKHEDIVAKVRSYLDAGVVVWEIDLDIQTVRVHQAGQLAVSFNASQELSADPYLPGFRVSVSQIFEE